jgi:Kef-type K+ transport system membrane component KefB
MNTGLIIIVLNIGLELKVLTPEVFTMMVIMALVTTFMTGPFRFNYIFKDKVVPDAEEITNQSKYRILFSFGTTRGKSLLRLANSLTKTKKRSNCCTRCIFR